MTVWLPIEVNNAPGSPPQTRPLRTAPLASLAAQLSLRSLLCSVLPGYVYPLALNRPGRATPAVHCSVGFDGRTDRRSYSPVTEASMA